MSTPGVFHPSRRLYRFTVLAFVSLLPFGSYFAYDSLGAIAPRLIAEEQDEKTEESGPQRCECGGPEASASRESKGGTGAAIAASSPQPQVQPGSACTGDCGGQDKAKTEGGIAGVNREGIAFTYTIYSIAAILSVLLGGILFDRIGPRLASLLFSCLVVAGTVVVALAPSMTWIYVGRFLFGAGAESLVVAQSAILARWFTGKELALSFGISLTICRLGTLFTFNTEELIASYFGGYRWALWAAVVFCLVALGGNVIYNALDKYGERTLGLAKGQAGDKIVMADIRKFGAPFWLVTGLCVTFYSAIFPFTALATDFFHDKWCLPTTSASGGSFLAQAMSNYMHMFSTAGGTTSIIIFASMVCAPFAGGLVDKVGKRATLMIAGAAVMIPCHLVMGLTCLPPQVPMILLGVAFVLVPAAMWPSVPLIVGKERAGTAFGLMTMLQNIGLALFPWLNGKLRDFSHSYEASMLMFAALGVVGLLAAIGLRIVDTRSGRKLESAG